MRSPTVVCWASSFAALPAAASPPRGTAELFARPRRQPVNDPAPKPPKPARHRQPVLRVDTTRAQPDPAGARPRPEPPHGLTHMNRLGPGSAGSDKTLARLPQPLSQIRILRW